MARGLIETVQLIYRSVLKREANPAEIELAKSRFRNGYDVVDLIHTLNNSREAESHKIQLFAPLGHFYSPVCDPDKLRERINPQREPRECDLRDTHIDIERMTSFWKRDLLSLIKTTPFSNKPSQSYRYRFENPNYSFGDAIVLRAMILHFRPHQIIEIGSGWSSACMLDTIAEDASLSTSITFIEPYPALLEKIMWPIDKQRSRVIAAAVQTVPLEEFEKLEKDDILFIDSTHVLKTGSDVVFELCEILPRLKPGVVIHFHDVFYPFEYPYKWAVEQNRSWNELYALRNFLAFNDRFEVIFFNDMFALLRRDVLAADYPPFLRNPGGAIWLQRVR